MSRIRHRRLAWMLLGLSVGLAVTVPLSVFVMISVTCPVCTSGVAEGAFAVTESRDSVWTCDYVIRSDGWEEPHYAFLPTFGRPGGRWELTVPVWMVFCICAVLTAIAFRRSRIPPGHCHKCGYDLAGNVSGRCPECGEVVRNADAVDSGDRSGET